MRTPVRVLQPAPRRAYLGIDPGLDGALAALLPHQRDEPVFVWDTPTLDTKRGKKTKREYNLSAMVQMLRHLNGTLPGAPEPHALIEMTTSRPGQGVASMWSQGYGVGIWEMAFAALGIPYTRVQPQVWSKAMLTGVGQGDGASILRAGQLFPSVNLKGPKGGPRDGRADALLIAEYLRRTQP